MKKVLLLVFGILFVSSVSAEDVGVGVGGNGSVSWVVIDNDIYFCMAHIDDEVVCIKAKKKVSK